MANKIDQINLIAKLVIIYIVLVLIALFIYYVCFEANSAPCISENQKNCIEAKDRYSIIATLLGWSASIFAPIAAILVLNVWKDQKKYDLEKQYAEEVLKLLNQTYKHLIIKYYIIRSADLEMLENFVALNSLYHKEDSFNVSETMYSVESQFETLMLISEKKISPNFYEKVKIDILLLDELIRKSLNKYKKYYDVLAEDIKNTNEDIFIAKKEKTGIILTESVYLKFEMSFRLFVNQKLTLTTYLDDRSKTAKYKNNLTGFKDELDTSYKNMVNELLKIIKL